MEKNILYKKHLSDEILNFSNEIYNDALHIKKFALRTPLIQLHWLSTKTRKVWAKLECNQLTNSFKIRGAYNAIRKLDKNVKIFAASAGNHGLAVAYVSNVLERDCTIYVPVNASELKLRRLIHCGITVESAGKDLFESSNIARQQAKRENGVFISPFSHPDVIKGQGSIAVEILEESKVSFDNLIIPLGGGGLLAGIASVFKSNNLNTKIIAVHPKAFNREITNNLLSSLSKGVYPTIADGLAVQHDISEIEFGKSLIPLIDSTFLVSEEEMEHSIVTLLHNEGVLAEGAAAISISPLIHDLDAQNMKGNILVIISGGNISASALMKCFATESKNSRLATLLGHQSTKLPCETEKIFKNEKKYLNKKNESDTANIVESSGIWIELFNELIVKFNNLEQDLYRNKEYSISENLQFNNETHKYITDKVYSSIATIKYILNKNLDTIEIRDYYRILIQEFSFLRNSLSWCSASSEQSCCVMFFDPQENNSSNVNYDRYGSMILREFEISLLKSLGFSSEENDLLLVSSGQAAYTVIESFLIGNILDKNLNVVTSPYIYFEAFEQLERLHFINISKAKSWDLDSFIELIEEKNAKVIFLDPMANLADLNVFDFKNLSKKIALKNWSDKWFIIDGTMISGGINVFHIFSEKNHPNILYYESGSKYLQLGLDLQMAGVIICGKSETAKLSMCRRNTGTVMYQAALTRFPEYNREKFLNRMHLLTRNSGILVHELENNPYISQRINIAYPKNWKGLGWNHGGGVVAISMKKIGLNNRSCLDAFIDILMSRCKEKNTALTKGVSFGFAVTRVSAAAAMADNMPPFLRFSIGEESHSQMSILSFHIVSALKEFLSSFE